MGHGVATITDWAAVNTKLLSQKGRLESRLRNAHLIFQEGKRRPRAMAEIREPEDKEGKGFTEKTETEEPDRCTGIEDPVRRGLCKVCGLPVIGEAPFCKDHEMPVP
jgi:hypothetical protein